MRLRDDVSLSLTFGAVRGFSEDEAVLRSASPLVEITLETGPTSSGEIAIELRNQHLDAQVRVARVTFLDSGAVDGCPVVTGVELDCVEATAALGQTCETSGQCPAGLRCAMGNCQASDLFDGCATPEVMRLQGQETSIEFDLDASACRRTRLETFLPENGEQTVRFAVIGPSRDVEVIEGLSGEFERRDVDFVLLLGDNVDQSTESGLIRLERVLTQLGTPAVVVAGPREVEPAAGEEFLRRFGPHDHVWQFRGVRFFAFYSAYGTLGPRGLTRLQGFLRQLRPEDESAPDTPLIGATHVPPIDPDGLRDNGFRNDIEALQVMSVLEEHGVHQLYAGGSKAEGRSHGVELFLTSARQAFASPAGEWLVVETAPGEGEGRVVGSRTITVDRIPLE